MILVTSRGGTIEVDHPLMDAHLTDANSWADAVIYQIGQMPYRFIQGDDLVGIDIGANVGFFALHLQDRCSRLLCVEPTPSHLDVLRAVTNEYSQIAVVDIALSDHDGTARFYLCGQNSTMNSMSDLLARDSKTPIVVPCLTIASLMDMFDVPTADFIKVDIEGAELAVLTDAQIGSVASRVRSWYVECHQTEVLMVPDPADVPASVLAHLDANRHVLAPRFEACGYMVEMIRHDALYAWR